MPYLCCSARAGQSYLAHKAGSGDPLRATTLEAETTDRGEGNRLGNLGLAYAALGDLVRARELWEQALKIYEATEDPRAKQVRGWLAALEESSTEARAV